MHLNTESPPSRTPAFGGHLVWTLILLWSVTGCASTRGGNPSDGEIPEGFPRHTVSQILTRLPAFPDDMGRLKLETQIAVSSPEMDGRFTALADVKRPDSLFVRIRFPLGIEGARVLITADSAFTYDRIENTVYRGSQEKMKEVLPGSLIGMDMIDRLTGFVRPDPGVSWRIQTDDSRYYLHAPDGSVRYTVDPVLWRIEHVQYRNSAGELTEQHWYLDFRVMDGVLVPSRVVLVQSEEQTRLSIAVKTLEKNPSSLHFDLGVRADTKWKDLSP